MSDKLSMHEWPLGFEPEPLEFTITPELNQQYLFAMEDFHPRYQGDDGIVHPGVLLNMSNTTRSPSYYLIPELGSLHSRDETRFYHPARVNRKLTSSWKLAEIYEKRGRTYHVKDARVHDEDGTLILTRMLYSTFSRKLDEL
ncbi:MAG: hotdog fold domain-containing protein [Dehalococcoidia bacterium]